ncbi:MAG: NAD-dependent epimerase/dehydratase family protein [Clostridiales bacterium]|nr:NAD-dependent epimerase/dehydratase family protein [Clostridiales bacterium]
MSEKKVLVFGGTGAMGTYLVPKLADRGYRVDVVSMDDVKSDNPLVTYHKANLSDDAVFDSFLAGGYDGIVDFMIYSTSRIPQVLPRLLAAADHYIYLSSYRIYANEQHPVKETSPRLLDVFANDPDKRDVEDYCLYKARGEDFLWASGCDNWTAIRPAITYSKRRFQLVTLEMNVVCARAFAGKTILLPASARDVQATMSWACDVAEMIARLLFNPNVRRDIYSVCTAEHHSWGTVAEYYRDLIGLRAEWVSDEDYIRCICGDADPERAIWQLKYDRLFDRIMDNSKVLAVTGLRQRDLSTLYDGLRRELSALDPATVPCVGPVNERMDARFAGR